MDTLSLVLASGIEFSRNLLGILFRPYQTYRRLVERGRLAELIYLGALLVFYFALASLIKTAAFRPFLLTKQFIVLSGGAAGGFLLAAALFWLVGISVGGQGKLVSFFLAWAYTLVPTLLWFLGTSVAYLLLPPPRTNSLLGITFSVVYLLFSASLFWWKLTLLYLTLRFGLKLDFLRIVAVIVVVFPLLGLWSWLMYRLGIFRVPFL